ncbi:MAG TPA: hypothetical protein VOA64_04255 [Candidatus Dormibacteraeota bacterium]|nr:hypothetical protein [Candidatus Dormibacteraeota bacterium]
MRVCGYFRILLLYDVAEGLDFAKLGELLGPRGGPVQRVFPRHTPEYIRFEQAPIEVPAEPVFLNTGEKLTSSIKYHTFAVVVVQFEVPFDCEWINLLAESSRWMGNTEVEPLARGLARQHLQELSTAVIRPNKEWLHESYLIINLQQAFASGSDSPPATQLLADHGGEIVRMVNGETSPLAPKICEEALQSSLSYYPSDLVVVASSGAFVYDRSEDAAATNQVLEYAKMQLLEFRYYDKLMTGVLSEVYDVLDKKRNFVLSRWSLPRDAQRFNTIRLDVMELTERVDNAIEFVSDIYYARVYRLAAKRVGVPEYRDLVDQKLRTVGELYDFMIDQFEDARSFVLEALIALLCLLDVILLLRGH